MPQQLSQRSRKALVAAVTALALVVPLVLAAVPAQAADRTVTLAGSLQFEIGCPRDWDETCPASELVKDPTGSTYRRTFTIPAGDYEFKVAIDRSWDENYGADGVEDGANMRVVVAGPASIEFVHDDETHQTTFTPTELPGVAVTREDRKRATDSLRKSLTKERFYFVLADRFANGSTANDNGFLAGDRLATGFDPTDKGFYHGGDLKGLIGKLDYIKGMGTTAIWLTPTFENRPVQGSGANASAGYHGYWITDFTKVDPHLGSNDEMKKLISQAHKRGMKVFFDIITNHTADVIDYADPNVGGGPYGYVDKTRSPYKDASGNTFDDRKFIGGTFPTLDPATSFPYVPTFRTPGDATVKVPAWLNDPTLYHNRGDSTFAGESSEYGDFSGLDDLFTENKVVVDGMTDIYRTWVDAGIDGFRIDTVKHVNIEFWEQFSPAILSQAARIGNKDFFMFGEVYDGNPAFTSQYTTTGRLPATLDFGFQGAAAQFVQGKPTVGLQNLFLGDDYYTDADSNAYSLPTFLGNHDMGRLSMMLTGAGIATPADRLKRLKLANQLMYLTRGQPVTYYGDEQGFIGSGGDKDSRQDMFKTKTAEYATQANAYGTSGAKDRFSTKVALYRQLQELAALRDAHPTLADGSQTVRYASEKAGIFAFSRLDPSDGREYVVAINNSTAPATADFETFSAQMAFRPVYGTRQLERSRGDARITVRVPALGVSVWKAAGKSRGAPEAPSLLARAPGSGGDFVGRAKIGAVLSNEDFAQVTFAYQVEGSDSWTTLGTDDNAPYAVYHDTSKLPVGSIVHYRMVSKDLRGRYAVANSWGVVGTKAAPASGGGSVPQPESVSVPGSFNSELGCEADWSPDCAEAQLSLDTNSAVWTKTITVPPGPYEYKVAIDKSWTENYGAGGVKDGPNIGLNAPATPVTFYYDHRTHAIQDSSTDQPIVVAAGSFQDELGCSGHWDPSCLRSWLTDSDGDGTYVWSYLGVPAGSYEFKIAYNQSWTENYGAGGLPDGANIPLEVPSGKVVTISFNAGTKVATAEFSDPVGSGPDLSQDKAVWVRSCLIAWPTSDVPAGENPAGLRWRLHVDDEPMSVQTLRIDSDRTRDLTYLPTGLPASVTAAHPELADHLALQPEVCSRGLRNRLEDKELAVGQYNDSLLLVGGTGVVIRP